MKARIVACLLGVSALLGVGFAPSRAEACGGFFCSQAAGVNQAAERIVFANNGDGTVTAVIEIQYQGPTDKFSWLLPISSVPMGDQIAVASRLSLQRLQQATNPQYSLTTRVEGTCDVDKRAGGFGGTASTGFPSASGGAGGASAQPDNGVTVEASGLVGSFEWTVISFDASLAEPAEAAVQWLGDNGYDVPQGAPGLLGPYLMDGQYLLALKLQKGATAGSIRPIVLTYSAQKPMIPIKLTAVAANDDMGVMTWLLADTRAVPLNYNALELNEARINWFNANQNYNAVVTAAANEAGGQGFVTEYARAASNLAAVVWTPSDEQTWRSYKQSYTPTPIAFDTAVQSLSQWDGFWDVVRTHVTLSSGVTVEQLQACPFCTTGSGTPDASFVTALETDVIEPARVVQKLIDAHPHVTRLYSTLSAPEMTVDPLFGFNATLPEVSNLHTATRVIECQPGYYTTTAPWRIELPQGDVVRGGATQLGNWPAAFGEQPANRRILRAGESGPGKVLEDNAATIDEAVATYNASLDAGPTNAGGMSSVGGATTTAGKPGLPDGGGTTSSPVANGDAVTPGTSSHGGCSIAGREQSSAPLLVLAGTALLLARRRRTER